MNAINQVFKPGLIAMAISWAAITSPAANASLKQELNSMFAEMSNVSQPGVHASQRRGVVFGGRVTTKNRIINQNVVSFIPPHIKAGCGGIDMFGGSFSFINSEQLVQLMRAVAQNAIGYAFQLALDAVCPVCSKHISFLQKEIAALNKYLGNSCQLAKGIVDTGKRALMEGFRKDEETAATDTGTTQDSASARTSEAGRALQRDKPSEYQKLIGNITWKELQKNRVSNWFRYGDNDLMEAMLSIAGSVIVGDLIDDPNTGGDEGGNKSNKITVLDGYLLKLHDLVFGAEAGRIVRMYDCSANRDTCAGSSGETPPGIKEVSNFEGLQVMIKRELLGTPGSSLGLINKYTDPDRALSDRFSSSEEAFLASLPQGVGGMIRGLSPFGAAGARQFVESIINVVAVEMAYELLVEVMTAVATAVNSSDSAFASEATKVIQSSAQKLFQERLILAERYGQLSEILADYETYMTHQRKQRYMYNQLTNDGKK